MPRTVTRVIMWCFLIVVAVLMISPVILALLGAFKSNLELNAGGSILPKQWHPGNFTHTWKEAGFSVYVKNSLIYAACSTLTTLVLCLMSAYALARRNFIGKSLILGVNAALMFIQLGALTLKPVFDMMVSLGLHRSIFGLIVVMTAAGGANLFIAYAFIRGIPRELDEAAMLDGASFAQIFRMVIVPLCLPAIGVIALFTFRAGWNSYIVPLVFTMSQPKLQPITVGLVNLRYGMGGVEQTNYMLAGAAISMIPMLIAYILMNRSFTQMNVGALKG